MAQIVYEKNNIIAAVKKLNEITVTGLQNAENLVLVAKLLDTGTEMAESDEREDKEAEGKEEEKENGER